ncbi:phosphotransferase [Zobellella sp. DQSA1]|uniref:phosphotransferase n=1 Tax=Zobellella sp. DQSA1 TaxID=3342386 RepID=UPI0035C1840E
MDAEPLLAALPAEWRGRLTPLAGGLTNRCWRLDTSRGAYWLRRGCADPAALGIDRRLELLAHQAAAAAGLALEVRFARPELGLLILDWREERDWRYGKPDLERLMSRVAALHRLPVTWPVLDLPTRVGHYLRRLAPVPGELSRLLPLFERSELNPSFSPVFCHHDLNAANLLGERPWLLDWEYAARGDAAFELAVIADSFNLGRADCRAMLAAYRAAGGELSEARLQARLPWVWLLTALWAAQQYRHSGVPLYLEQQQQAVHRLCQYQSELEWE